MVDKINKNNNNINKDKKIPDMLQIRSFSINKLKYPSFSEKIFNTRQVKSSQSHKQPKLPIYKNRKSDLIQP